jgi:heme-degrading monooxygenase HmoA
MHAIATALQAAGLDAHVHETRGVLDVTATSGRSGAKDTEVTVDDDGYVVVSYWNDPDATPAHITAVIRRVLTAISELL